jgi:ectoine hydroxylase
LDQYLTSGRLACRLSASSNSTAPINITDKNFLIAHFCNFLKVRPHAVDDIRTNCETWRDRERSPGGFTANACERNGLKFDAAPKESEMMDTDLYDEHGFLMLKGLISATKLEQLRSRVVDEADPRSPGAVVTDSGELQAIYGVHLIESAVIDLLRTPAINALLQSIVGGAFYLYQSQLHLKPASSLPLDWHQDFRAYHDYDGLPAPDGAIVATFLDSIMADMGAVQVIPGSHRRGLLPAEMTAIVPEQGPSGGTRASHGQHKTKYEISDRVLSDFFQDYEVHPLTGDAGSIFVCHPCLVHGSGINRTGRRRAILYTNVFRCGVTPQNFSRPTSVVTRNFDPIGPA